MCAGNVERTHTGPYAEILPRGGANLAYGQKRGGGGGSLLRPIVSGCGGPTENISQLVDLHLKPHAPKITSYLRDSGHLISIIERTPIPTNCTLATIDVKSLYLNIPHEDGIKAVLNRLYYTQELAN